MRHLVSTPSLRAVRLAAPKLACIPSVDRPMDSSGEGQI
jgi:hypothetical protein